MQLLSCSQRIYLIPLLLLSVSACSTQEVEQLSSTGQKNKTLPADVFDLSQWSLTIPFDFDDSGSADTVSAAELSSYHLEEFFYLDELEHLVFTAPNKATTTPNSTNTRTEFRQVFNENMDGVTGFKAHKNYFSLASNTMSEQFAAVGGSMEATLRVNHVSTNAKYPNKPPAYSVVVGQIHAGKLEHLRTNKSGLGWGNEPLKIYYKKFPHHDTGSVFWNYERNLPKNDPNRIDIDHSVWGVGWSDNNDPKSDGIALDEEFSYTVNVVGDIMHLEFSSDNHPTVRHKINLANNVDANGKLDMFDDLRGYQQDWLFFKVGAYNQCSTKDAPSFRYPACPGTGDWSIDKAKGNYTRVTFSKIKQGKALPPW